MPQSTYSNRMLVKQQRCSKCQTGHEDAKQGLDGAELVCINCGHNQQPTLPDPRPEERRPDGRAWRRI